MNLTPSCIQPRDNDFVSFLRRPKPPRFGKNFHDIRRTRRRRRQARGLPTLQALCLHSKAAEHRFQSHNFHKEQRHAH